MTTGHTPDGSGLQNHSIGGLYPHIIIYRPFTRTWEVSHRDGRSTNHSSYDAALRLKELDALLGKRVALASREHPRTGTVQSISHGINATVAVRFDGDSYDTAPNDLRAQP